MGEFWLHPLGSVDSFPDQPAEFDIGLRRLHRKIPQAD
jgi:hypothetical protein